MKYFPCPNCERKAALKHSVNYANKAQLYYGCTHCRHHFQVLHMDGEQDKIVAESPRDVHPAQETLSPDGIAGMGCPSCTRYGKVRATHNHEDGFWRRHQCVTCGPYFTCQTEDGVSVHRQMKSVLAVDLEGA